MKFNIKAVVIAEAVVGAVLFILCRLAFVAAPEATLAALKYLTHIDWSPVTMPVTLGGFFAGLIVFTIFMALIGATWAGLYNFIADESKVRAVQKKAASAGLSHHYLHLQ